MQIFNNKYNLILIFFFSCMQDYNDNNQQRIKINCNLQNINWCLPYGNDIHGLPHYNQLIQVLSNIKNINEMFPLANITSKGNIIKHNYNGTLCTFINQNEFIVKYDNVDNIEFKIIESENKIEIIVKYDNLSGTLTTDKNFKNIIIEKPKNKPNFFFDVLLEICKKKERQKYKEWRYYFSDFEYLLSILCLDNDYNQNIKYIRQSYELLKMGNNSLVDLLEKLSSNINTSINKIKKRISNQYKNNNNIFIGKVYLIFNNEYNRRICDIIDNENYDIDLKSKQILMHLQTINKNINVSKLFSIHTICYVYIKNIDKFLFIDSCENCFEEKEIPNNVIYIDSSMTGKQQNSQNCNTCASVNIYFLRQYLSNENNLNQLKKYIQESDKTSIIDFLESFYSKYNEQIKLFYR